jgi:5-methyltetrahydropteroyltriglutamate--homocysteine methyltransferase
VNRSDQRILTTHTGSLIRPPELLDLAQRARDGNESDQAAYAQRLREAVAEVVRKQREVGIDVVSDGEFGKSSWAAYILERLTGFEIRPDQLMPLVWLGRDRERFADFFAESDMPGALRGAPTEVCVGPITYQGQSTLQRDLANFQAAVDDGTGEAFFTAVAPASTAYNGINEYYANDHDYVFAIAEALRQEYQAILDTGVILQVDDAVLANMYDYLVQQSPERYREWAQLRVDALNHALEGIPPERVRYHVCFGSWHVPHVADAPLEDIIDFILQVKAGAYSLEAANPRHEHEWRIWETRKLAPGQILIPGVITHHLTTVEHPRLVADRIIRFARLVGRENVIAGTDCGFAQSQGTRRVHPSVMWAKFESLVEGARIATRELWS